jgi:ADP-heptose:LPS heptosyltransferase
LHPNEKVASAPASHAKALLPALPQGAEVLLLRLRSLGDLVLETSVIRALHEWRPDLRISVLAEERFAAVFEGNPAVTEVILSGGLMATASELRRRNFAVAFNQHGGPRSAMLTAMSGAGTKVGWRGYQYDFVYDVKVPDAQEFFAGAGVVPHTLEHRLSQLWFTGLPRGPVPPAQLFPQPDAAASAAQELAEKGIAAGTPYAVLQPGARTPAMRWPLENFAALAKWLRSAHNIASVVNIGARDEALAVQAASAFHGIATTPAPPLDVRELIALTASASLFVGNDSGPAHIASALDRPTVTLFSETDPAQWGPRNARAVAIGTGATFTHPRGDKAVLQTQPRLITSIPLEEVQQACEKVLQK